MTQGSCLEGSHNPPAMGARLHPSQLGFDLPGSSELGTGARLAPVVMVACTTGWSPCVF